MGKKWRPIATAPKDATEVWLGAAGKVILGWFSNGAIWKSSWTTEPLQWKPTHWQPFEQPKPPR